MRLVPFAITAFLALVPVAAMAQDEEAIMGEIEALHGESAAFGEVFGLLQDAFLFGDPTSIADLAFYPLEVAANGELYDILEPEDLVENFDALVMPETQEALASQDFADLIVTGDGVGFADGALWMGLVCLDEGCAEADWGIIRINN